MNTVNMIAWLNGYVIGEFICNEIEQFVDYDEYNEPYWNFSADLKEIERVKKETCLTLEQIIDYVGDSKNAYGWHISNLVIYDEPKELSEFCAIKKCNSCKQSGYESSACIYDEKCEVPTPIKKAPQSWCYCEELK